MKSCSLCKLEKPFSEFYKDKQNRDGHSSQCKPCVSERSRINRQKNPEKYRQTAYKRAIKDKYGITLEERQQLLESQGHRCAICSTDTPTGTGTWHVDHCHTTGKVRGLLCSRCNQALGLLNDDINLFSNAISYLSRAAESPA